MAVKKITLGTSVRRRLTRLIAVFVLFFSMPTFAQETLADDVLTLAEDVGRWLISTNEETSDTRVWPDDMLNPEAVSYDLAAGVAGKVVFFSALYRATGKDEYRAQANLGADYLVALLSEPAPFDDNNRKASLYSGIAGIGVALFNAMNHTQAQSYDDGVTKIVSLLDRWKIEDEFGVFWSEDFNDLIYGDAGTVLFLTWYGQRTGNERALSLAESGAKSLLARAENTAAQKYWRFRRSKPFNIPNFSHGTAGVGYVLASVGMATGDSELKQGAQAAFTYIKSIAKIEDGRLQIPYGWPNESWDGLFEFGWAHGLAGNISFFRRLQEARIDVKAAAEYERMAIETLTAINLPGQPRAPFSEPATALDLRFGRAGVLAAISISTDPAVPTGTTLQTALLRHLEDKATRQKNMAHWQTAVPDFMGGGQAAYTGLFHGASGIGLSLLTLHAQLVGADAYADLPDYPN